jgi:hypothetical protein
MQQAAQHGLLIMVHAENGDVIHILVKEAGFGNLDAEVSRADPPARVGGRGDQPRHPPGRGPARRCMWCISPTPAREAVRLARAAL